MLKGLNRNVIVVKGNGKSRFETVYFIMKRGASSAKKDLADEAQRLIGDSGLLRSPSQKRLSGMALFGLGALIGMIFSSVVWLALLICL